MTRAEHLRRMHDMYGKDYAQACGACRNFLRLRTDLPWRCRCYSLDNYDDAGWDAEAIACGHFGEYFDERKERPVLTLYRQNTAARVPGQCSLLEARKEEPMESAGSAKQDASLRMPAGASSLSLLEELAWAEMVRDEEIAEACRMALRTLHDRAACGPYTIAVDFDGVLCEDDWPHIGAPREGVIRYLRELRETYQVRLILWTCRTGARLLEAQDWCAGHDLRFDAVNGCLPEHIQAFGGDTPEVFADEYWDDRNVCL